MAAAGDLDSYEVSYLYQSVYLWTCSTDRPLVAVAAVEVIVDVIISIRVLGSLESYILVYNLHEYKKQKLKIQNSKN